MATCTACNGVGEVWVDTYSTYQRTTPKNMPVRVTCGACHTPAGLPETCVCHGPLDRQREQEQRDRRMREAIIGLVSECGSYHC